MTASCEPKPDLGAGDPVEQTPTDAVHRHLAQHRVVPVVVLQHAHHVAELAQALLDGGLPLAEITFRTPAAEQALRQMAADGRVLVGAGRVITTAQVDIAVDAGASFIVSPGLSPAVVRRCLRLGVPLFPGISSPPN